MICPLFSSFCHERHFITIINKKQDKSGVVPDLSGFFPDLLKNQ